MKIKSAFPFFILLVVYLASCTSAENNAKPKESELTLLMRKMYDETLDAKKAILAGEVLTDINHEAILTSKTTQPEKAESELYKTFAYDYLTKLEQLNKADNLYKTAAFKNVVNSCMNCHSSLCPGPLVRIDKLKM